MERKKWRESDRRTQSTVGTVGTVGKYCTVRVTSGKEFMEELTRLG